MKRTGFEYKIYGQVTFTGKELWLLKQCSDTHYDHACRTVFADGDSPPYKNFGRGWIVGDLLWDEHRRRRDGGEDIEWDGSLKLEDCLEAETTVKAGSDELDFCMKILEPSNRLVLKEEADRQACGELSSDIHKVFREITEEWHLRTYGIGYQVTDDFRWHVIRAEETEYWHDVETPRVRELAEEYLLDRQESGLLDNLLVALRRRKDGVDVAKER